MGRQFAEKPDDVALTALPATVKGAAGAALLAGVFGMFHVLPEPSSQALNRR